MLIQVDTQWYHPKLSQINNGWLTFWSVKMVKSTGKKMSKWRSEMPNFQSLQTNDEGPAPANHPRGEWAIGTDYPTLSLDFWMENHTWTSWFLVEDGGSVSRSKINFWGQSQPVFTKLPWPLPLYPKLLVGWLTILLGFTEPSAQVSSAIGAQSLLCNRNLRLLWVVPTVLLTFWPCLLLRRQHGIPCMNHSWNNQ